MDIKRVEPDNPHIHPFEKKNGRYRLSFVQSAVGILP
ncbi:hypothetical protein ABIB62_004611 [Mucilaginibacter sp. UYP25]